MSGLGSYLTVHGGSSSIQNNPATPLLNATGAENHPVVVSVATPIHQDILARQNVEARNRAANCHGRFSLALFGALSIASLALSVLPLIQGDTSYQIRGKLVMIGGCAFSLLVREIVGYAHRHKRFENSVTPRIGPNGYYGIFDLSIAIYSIVLGIDFNDALAISYGSLVGLRVILPYKTVISACMKLQRCCASCF